MVSLGSVGKSIKCPKCERRLRVPKNAVHLRRKQLADRQTRGGEKADPKPTPSKIKTTLSSLVDIPEPEAPPLNEPTLTASEASIPGDEKRSEKKRRKKKKRKKRRAEVKSDDSKRLTPVEPVEAHRPERPSTESTDVAEDEVTAPADNAAKTSERDADPAASDSVDEPVSPKTREETTRADLFTPPESVAAFQEPDLTEAEPPPLKSVSEDEDLPVYGYQADRDKVATVRWLAAALVGISLFGLAPAAQEIVKHVQLDDGSLLNRWVYASLLIGGLQLAYAGYLAQLPDWSSVWVVTVFSLVVASVYAAMLCVTLLAGIDSDFVQALDLAERLRGGKATGWCFVMLCITGLLAYSSGRVGSRWRQAFAV